MRKERTVKGMSAHGKSKICIATRGSMLALWQANHVKRGLEKANPGLAAELLVLKTKGDKILDVALAKVGGKGLFVKEIEEALLDGRADLAVHSMKDVPTELPSELELAATDVREDVRDALFTREASGLDDLPQGAKIGTSSLRRQAQLLHRRPDFQILPIRGNVDTRLRKLHEEELDAVILAAAGVKRLGFADRVTEYLPVSVSLPATCQGSLGIEIRRDDDKTRALVETFFHRPTHVAVSAERAFLRTLEGGCQVPIAGLATVENGKVLMDGLVGSVDGTRLIREQREGPEEEAEEIGVGLAQRILEKGGREILREVYESEGKQLRE
jgi:hydroxymethylbilane synthase